MDWVIRQEPDNCCYEWITLARKSPVQPIDVDHAYLTGVGRRHCMYGYMRVAQ
jgi:hypothetical protein